MKFSGKVSEGVQVGAKFGIATANLRLEVAPALAEGVYLVQVRTSGSPDLSGLLHFGEKKTFGDDFSAEVHILDFDQDIYGQTLEITVLKKLRDVLTFSNADALFTQVENDIVKAQKYFLRRNIHQTWSNLDQTERKSLSEAAYHTVSQMPEFHSAKVVYAYAPDDFEIGFVEKLCKENNDKTWCFPRIAHPLDPLSSQERDGVRSPEMTFHPVENYQDLKPGYLDLLEPPTDQVRTSPSPDLVLVPAVAGSPDGQRLGRGGGFYDRFLADNTAPTVCVLPKFAVLEQIPCEEHDQSIDKIVKI